MKTGIQLIGGAYDGKISNIDSPLPEFLLVNFETLYSKRNDDGNYEYLKHGNITLNRENLCDMAG